MKRPLAAVALCYGGGLLLAEWCQPPLGLLFALALSLVAGTLSWPQARRWLIWPLVFVCGWTNLVWHTAIVSPYDLRVTQTNSAELVTVRGRLPETPSQRIFIQDEKESTRSLAQLEVTHLLHKGTQWQPALGRILVLTPGQLPPDYFAGQLVEVCGALAPPPGPQAEGLFDYQAYLRRQGIYYQLKSAGTNEWTLLSTNRTPPLTDRFLAWAQATLARGLPGEDESLRLLWAMTLGWKTGLTNEVYEPFMRSGTLHIFAISGLHIALIAGILVSLLRVARVSRGWCGIIIIPLIWFYTGATGWQPSAIRSTVMMSIIIFGWALKRPTDLLNSLAGAAWIILLWDPQQLFGASFQLSFFVVLSIALLLPPLERVRDRLLQTDPFLPAELVPRWQRWLHKPIRWTTNCLATSLASWLGSMPLTAYYFHLLSPVTLLANLVIVPLSSLALACNLGSLLCGHWLPWFTELFNQSAWWWMTCMVRLSYWSTLLPEAFLYVRGPTLLDFVVYYTLLIALLSGWLLAPNRRRWALAGLIVLAGIALGHWQAARRTTTLTLLPVHGGTSLYFHGPRLGRDLLIDTGKTNSVEFVTKPFLRAQGVNRLPHLLLTHGDLRHIGGAELIADLFAVRQVGASSARSRSATYRQALAHFSQNTNWLCTLQRDNQLGPWRLLHPDTTDRFSRGDDSALVLLGNLHGTRILLLSDLGRTGQDALLARTADLHADIVVTGLPTAGEPLCEALLDAIQPRLILIADSEFPAAERASPKLRERLARREVPVVYTRFTGAATIEFRPGQWGLRTMSGFKLTGTHGVTTTRTSSPKEAN